MSAQKFLHHLSDSSTLVLGVALVLGLLLPDYLVVLEPYSTWMLGTIFFLSALTINLREARKYLRDKTMLAVVVIFMLLLFPVITYYVTRAIAPDLAIAFLILAAMPSGMTAPLLCDLCGGKQSLAIVLTILTSLLAPLTVPLMVGLLAGATVEVEFLSILASLAKVILIPFVLANIIKYFWSDRVSSPSLTTKTISVALLGLLIMGIVAKHAEAIRASWDNNFWYYIAGLFIFFLAVHVIGYFAAFWRKHQDRITVTICLSYMNFTLAIYLVGTYFDEPNIVVPVILSMIPWTLLLIPFKFIAVKFRA